MLFLVDCGQVIVAQLDVAIEGHNVPQIERRALCLEPSGDALQLFLVFGIDMRPEHRLASLAKEAPRALVLMRRGHAVDVDVVFNLAGKKIAVLEADLLGRSFQVDIGPAALIELVATLETRIL